MVNGILVFYWESRKNGNACGSTIYTWVIRISDGSTIHTWVIRTSDGSTIYTWVIRTSDGSTIHTWVIRTSDGSTIHTWVIRTSDGFTVTLHIWEIRLLDGSTISTHVWSDYPDLWKRTVGPISYTDNKYNMRQNGEIWNILQHTCAKQSGVISKYQDTDIVSHVPNQLIDVAPIKYLNRINKTGNLLKIYQCCFILVPT